MADSPDSSPAEVPASYYRQVVRRYAHDVRNHLNALDLDTMLLEEILTDESALQGLARMRRNGLRLEEEIKRLSLKFEPPRPVTVTAGDVIQLWQLQVARSAGAEVSVLWPEAPPAASLHVDAKALVSGLTEWTLSAGRRSQGQALRVAVMVDDGGLLRIALGEAAGIPAAPEDLTGLMTIQMRISGVAFSYGPGAGGEDRVAWFAIG